MSDTLIAGIYGGLLGSFIIGTAAWFVGARARRHSYYSTLLKLMGDHNWNCLSHKISAGLPICYVDDEIATLCYQHINLLFYAWVHRGIIKKDGSLRGWKRWAEAIVEGAKLTGNEKYSLAYRDILVHGDLYPDKFRDWLKKKLAFSADRFPPKTEEHASQKGLTSGSRRA